MLDVIRGRCGSTALGVVLVTVVAVQAVGQEPVTTPGGTIEGTIYDSLLTRGPLKGATVYVVGTNQVVTSDVRGRFSIARVPDATTRLRSRMAPSSPRACVLGTSKDTRWKEVQFSSSSGF